MEEEEIPTTPILTLPPQLPSTSQVSPLLMNSVSNIKISVIFSSFNSLCLLVDRQPFVFIQSKEFGKLSKLKLDFPFEVLCIDVLTGGNVLIGNDKGLYHLNRSGQLVSIITGKRFQQLEVLPALGIVLALCGTKSPEVRMYSLTEITAVVATGVRSKEMQLVKLKNSVGCSHFVTKKIGDAWFLVLSVKKKVILYLWDHYPHYKFLIVKDWSLKAKAIKTQIVERNGMVSQICVMQPKNFMMIDTTSGVKSILDFQLDKKNLPCDVCLVVENILLLSFTDIGFFVNGSESARMSTSFDWSLSVVSTAVAGNFVVCLSEKGLEVMFVNRPKVAVVISQDLSAIKFLRAMDGHVYFSAKSLGEYTSIFDLAFELAR